MEQCERPCIVHPILAKVVSCVVELLESVSSLQCRLEIAEEAINKPLADDVREDVPMLDELERRICDAVLSLHRGSSDELAKELGISPRAIRYEKRRLKYLAGGKAS